MRNIHILPSFERAVKQLSPLEKKQLGQSLDTFNTFLLTGKPSFGLRLKKINHDNYEFRINLKLRVIVRIEDEDIYLVLVGSHDDVKRYLRQYR
jgi:mRNA-degrading endonuclease RelE of RelBE toxin-antitoxin system